MMRLTTVAMIAGLQAGHVIAAPLTVTSSVLTERHVAAADGTTRTMLVRADHAAAGDHVTVAVDYRNTGRETLAGLVLAKPVPPGLVYRGPASGSPAPELSADGRRFAAMLPAGIDSAQVIIVRWRLATPLAPGGSGRLAFAATLK